MLLLVLYPGESLSNMKLSNTVCSVATTNVILYHSQAYKNKNKFLPRYFNSFMQKLIGNFQFGQSISTNVLKLNVL
jgi:succinylarginine dihydrolase